MLQDILQRPRQPPHPRTKNHQPSADGAQLKNPAPACCCADMCDPGPGGGQPHGELGEGGAGRLTPTVRCVRTPWGVLLKHGLWYNRPPVKPENLHFSPSPRRRPGCRSVNCPLSSGVLATGRVWHFLRFTSILRACLQCCPHRVLTAVLFLSS